MDGRIAQLEQELSAAYDALREAGDKARDMRADVARLTAEQFLLIRTLTEILQDDHVPERVRETVRDVLEGSDE